MPFVYFFQCLSDFKILSMWTMVSFRLFFCILNFVIKKPPVYYLPGYFLYIRCGFLLWAHCSEAHFCLCSSHAAWVTELNSNIPLVPWRQNRPRAMTISRLEVSCSITVCVCIHPTLRNPMDCISPVSSAHGILQAKVLEWLAISCSKGSSQPRDWTWVSCIAGGFFIIWATKEDPLKPWTSQINTTVYISFSKLLHPQFWHFLLWLSVPFVFLATGVFPFFQLKINFKSLFCHVIF